MKRMTFLATIALVFATPGQAEDPPKIELPKSPAKGETTIGTGGGKLETQLLVASTFREAARVIVADLNKLKNLERVAELERVPAKIPAEDPPKILIVQGEAMIETGRLLAFHSQAYSLRKLFERTRSFNESSCDPTKEAFLPLGSIGPLATALADLLKTDIEITAIDSTLTSASLSRAIVAASPATFTTTFRNGVDPGAGRVAQTICQLEMARDTAEFRINSASEKDKKKNPRLYAMLESATKAYDAYSDRLWKSEADKPPLFALILLEERVDAYPDRILRVWVDANGGTVIKRKSFWTMLGARSVGMTGGSVISYQLTEKDSGDVFAAGFIHCNTKLVSLRTAHKDAFAQAFCEPVAPLN